MVALPMWPTFLPPEAQLSDCAFAWPARVAFSASYLVTTWCDRSRVYGLGLRRDICREIRRLKPDAVLGGGYEVEAPYGFDQADHRAAGPATLDAVRDAGNRWVFPEQIDDEGLEAHTVRRLLLPGLPGFGATQGVEVTAEPLRHGVASLEAHAAYLAALPDHPAPEDFIPKTTATGGRATGVEHAVLFRAHDLQAPPDFLGAAGQE